MQTFEETTVSRSMEISTFGTGFGCVLSRNFDHFNTFSFSFVGQELLELGEAPVMQPSVESSSFTLFADSLERFQYDYITRFENSDYLFGNFMVDLSHKTVFSSSNLLEQSFGGASAFSLKLRSEVSEFGFPLLNPSTFEKLAIGSDSQLIDSQVNTDYLSVATKRSVDSDLTGKCDVDKQSLLSVKHEVGRADLPAKILSEIFRNFDLYPESAFDRGERDLVTLETEASRIITDCHKLLADRLPSLEIVCLEYIAGNIPATANKLCRELAMLSNGIIGDVMEFPFVKTFQFITPVKDSLDCSRVLLHSFKNFLFDWNSDFDCGNGFHSKYLMQRYKYVMEVKSALSPPMNSVGFQPTN